MTDTKSRSLWLALLAVSITVFLTGTALAHGVAEGDQAYLQQTSGPQIGAFMYLGAKHIGVEIDPLRTFRSRRALSLLSCV